MFPRLLLLLCSLLLLPLYGNAVPQGTDLSQLNKGEDISQNYRRRVFHAYMPLDKVNQTLKVYGYSNFENPTGIYYKEGQKVRITLHDRPDGEISFIIHSFGKEGEYEVYPLKEGVNDFVAKKRGLGYVNYRSPKGGKADTVRVSLRGGSINGIFSRHDDADTWKRLINRDTPSEVFDMVGERCQLVFTVEDLRKGAGDQGPELLEVYDRIVSIEQQLMGWDQEGIHPGNHIMFRVVWGGYLFADGWGGGANKALIADISNPEHVRTAGWGIAHEYGHVNQPRALSWAGMVEVSVNIFSAWCTYQLQSGFLNLDHEVHTTLDGHRMRGGRMDCYVNAAIVRRQLWQFLNGPDNMGELGAKTGDSFVSLCPLWQLHLYFSLARGKKDFYPTIFRKARASQDEKTPHGRLRVRLCEQISEIPQLNMSEFLTRTGMLAPMNRRVPDYCPHMVTISEKMVRDALLKALKYPEPDSSVIYYINCNNVHIYRDKLALKPSKFRPAVPQEGGRIVFPANEWKNAVAFEVYEGKKLVRICLRGLGQEDNASTTVICPEGATTIMAVQWDGRRAHVSGKKLPPGSIPGNRHRRSTPSPAGGSHDSDDGE